MSMKLRRSLLAAGVPLTAGLALAGTALAADGAPRVTVRVEGRSATLLATRTVSAPASGSITKGRAPAGSCSADSAAGALSAATHGRWNGTYYTGLGIDVTTILGRTPAYDGGKGSYWELFVDDRAASKGICDIKPRRGESLLFAQVPAKGKPELPIVVTAPKTVTAGKAFDVRAFVYTGKGHATRPVSNPRVRWSVGARTRAGHPRLRESTTGRRGVLRFTVSGAGSATATLVVSARGEIRSAATRVRIVK